MSCVNGGQLKSLAAFLFAAQVLIACGSSYESGSVELPGGNRGNGDQNPASPIGARLIEGEAQRPPCVDEIQGLLIYRLDTQAFEVCAVEGWALVDIKGDSGMQGPPGPNGPVGGEGPEGPKGPNGAPGVSASTATVFVYDRDGNLIGYPDWTKNAAEMAGAIGVFLNSGFYLELFTGTGLARANNEILQACFFEQPNCQGDCRVASPNQLAYGETSGDVVVHIRRPIGQAGNGFTASSAWGKGSCRSSSRVLSSSFATELLPGYPFAAPLHFKLQVE
jgi:hypothetical protein